MTAARPGRVAVAIGRALVPAAVLGLWALLARAAGETFLPGPAATLRAFVHGVETGWLTENLGLTLYEAGLGFAWAVALGLPLGFALGLSRLLREAYEAPLMALYAIPKVTLFPIFLFLFKLGPESKVAFGAFHGLFPVAILTWSAMRAMRPVHLRLARALALTPWQTARFVVLPAVLPSVAAGLRLALNLTLLGVILGEMFAARAGLGFLLMASGAAFDMPRILVVIVLVSLLAVTANAVVLAGQRRLERRFA